MMNFRSFFNKLKPSDTTKEKFASAKQKLADRFSKAWYRIKSSKRDGVNKEQLKQWFENTKSAWQPTLTGIRSALPKRFPRTLEEWKNVRPQEIAENLTTIFRKGSFGSYLKYGAIAAAAYFIADTVALFSGNLIPEPPVVPAPIFRPKKEKRAAVEEYASITSRNIFNSKGFIPDELMKADPNGPARKTNLPLNLIGTIVLLDELKSIATIEDKSANKVLPVRINESMEGKITIKKIEHLKVVFVNNQNGTLEYIDIPESQLLGVGVKSSAVTKNGTIEKEGETNFKIQKTELDKAFGNLNEILKQARAVPVFENGVSVGYKIVEIQPNSIYSKLGITEGDIITAVNGDPISDPGKAFQLMNELKSGAGHMELTVKTPDGKVRTQVYDIR